MLHKLHSKVHCVNSIEFTFLSTLYPDFFPTKNCNTKLQTGQDMIPDLVETQWHLIYMWCNDKVAKKLFLLVSFYIIYIVCVSHLSSDLAW